MEWLRIARFSISKLRIKNTLKIIYFAFRPYLKTLKTQGITRSFEKQPGPRSTDFATALAFCWAAKRSILKNEKQTKFGETPEP